MAYPQAAEADDAFEAWLARRQAEGALYVIAEDQAALGFVQLHAVHRKGAHGWLALALAPAARGQGHGAAALAALEEEARGTHGLRKLLLQVRSDNASARALYARMGYREVGLMQGHYRALDGTWVDVAIMEKQLTGP